MKHLASREEATPLAHSIAEFTKIACLSRTAIYEAIKARDLKVRKFGRRTLILAAEGQAFLNSLPRL